MMGTGVQMEMVNIQGMAPTGGARDMCIIYIICIILQYLP